MIKKVCVNNTLSVDTLVRVANKVNEVIRALNTMERDRTSGVGAEAPSCIPTPRSQPAVSDDPQPAQARTASNTSQLVIAARNVVSQWEFEDGMVSVFNIDQLRYALQHQA